MLKAKILEDVKGQLVTLLLLIFFISEAISKYSIFYLDGKSDIPRFIKFSVFLFLILSLLKHFKPILLPFLLATIFCVGQIFLIDGFRTEVLVSGGKLLFPLFLFIYFTKYPLKENHRKQLFRIFEYILIINGILIFIGLFWEIHLFKSYPWGRFGYNGLFINSSTSSYVYAIALFYILLKLKNNFLKNWKSIFVIVCAILTGTKILYVALATSLIIYLLYFVNFSKTQRRIFVLGTLTVFASAAYFFFFQYGIFNEIREDQGLFSAIFSFRDNLLLEKTLPFIRDNWSLPNYLFGGISDLATRSQFGFIDIFYFFGILGGLFYLYVFYKTFVTYPLDKIAIYILLSLMLIVFLAGNFFENASVAIYLLILKESMMESAAFSNRNDLNE